MCSRRIQTVCRVFAVRHISRQTVEGVAHGPNSERRRRGFAHGIAAAARRTARQIGVRQEHRQGKSNSTRRGDRFHNIIMFYFPRE